MIASLCQSTILRVIAFLGGTMLLLKVFFSVVNTGLAIFGRDVVPHIFFVVSEDCSIGNTYSTLIKNT
jgi:hypothetical protein